MVTINKSTLRQNVYETIYDTLTNANLLSGSVTVTAAYIDDDKAFPQVVVNPIDVTDKRFRFDRDYSTDTIKVLIEIYTKKNKEKDQISDEIDALSDLKNILGVSLVGWQEDNALESIGGSKIHLKTIMLTYLY